MTNNEPEWQRWQRALSVEADRGFNDIQGSQYRFSEFLAISLRQLAAIAPTNWRDRSRQLATEFDIYPEKDIEERRFLIAQTSGFLTQMQRIWETENAQQTNNYSNNSETAEPSIATPKTAPLNSAPAPLSLSLDQALTRVTGIGPANGNRLAKLGLYTVHDLLYYYPRNHIDYAKQVQIRDLVAGETVTLVAEVKRCNCFSSPKNKKLTILEVILKDRTGEIKLSRFFAGPRYSNRGWQEHKKREYCQGAILAASGLVKQNKYGITLENPELEVLDDSGSTIESMKVGRVIPVYPLTDGVDAGVVRRGIVAVTPAAKLLPESLPDELREKYGLMGIADAVSNIHFPLDRDCLAAARRRLVFDEFFYLQLGLLKRRQTQKKAQASAVILPNGKLIEHFYEILPFALTNAQQRVINDILNDLASTEPMNRLVQGDVGAGKTVVAVVAMLAAIQSGYQAALMAPTEVLAEQHYRKLVGWFNLMHLSVELLTGSTKIAKRREIHSQLETGELPVLVGTHALIQDTVNFSKLGLAVIDEQHRFGVQQRAKLQQKGESPHVLTMTATPIPRTLALTLHGDLDVSQIDELPPGRQAIQTTVLSSKERSQAYELIRREVASGRQIYVVLPLVEESEKLDVRSAIEEQEKLQVSIFPEFKVGLLHGRMSSADKDDAITKFRDKETDILVSTTVVEVGVDVPNATVMLIENSERFGLSQLHQLRGRVGRGSSRSYCLLMPGSKATEAMQRMKVLEQSQDGFFIAEMDMRLRGPGQVLGTRQSGLPDFALASLVEDQEVLELAREAAQMVIDSDESLDEWPVVRDELERRYQRMMSGSILT
ncbi:MAG: ATP-dependent DNA helicase RecG [Richelia sp. CSU_2_1]|nr:ATP-dependent DNA helicase RecG [Richelia sp. CSU_2_1]